MKSFALAIISTLAVANTHVSAENILTNGSFEIPAMAGQETSMRSTNNTLVGWTIGPTGSIYLVRPPATARLAAVDGNQYVDLNGAGVTLAQSFETITGQVYEVSFVVGYYQATNVLSMQLTARVTSGTGELLANLTVPSPRQSGWNPPSRFRFMATTPASTLTFTDNTGTVNYDLTLDDVAVERATPRLSITCSHVRLCWESQSDRFYQLQYRPDLNSQWIDFGEPIPGTGITNCVTQEITDMRRFFRALALP